MTTIVERIEVRLLDLPLVEPMVAAHGTTTERALVVVRVDTSTGHGWGECSALPEPTYTAEFAAAAHLTIAEVLASLVVGRPATPEEAMAAMNPVVGHPMAKAAVEMAVLDAALRAEGRSLAAWLGTTATAVPAGAAVGLGSPGAVADRAEALAAEGYGRLKLKIEPGRDRAVVEAVADRLTGLGGPTGTNRGVELQVDANGSYDPADGGHLDSLIALACSGLVSAIEQPLPPDAVDTAARLVAASPVPIVADEAASSLAAVRVLLDGDAASGISIKPPRVGGIVAAVTILDLCRRQGVPTTAGGMVECGLGRHALAAVAALDGFTVAGDVSPAARWLAADPWPDLTLSPAGILVPTGPGIAPDPNTDLLDRLTRHHVTIER